MTKYVTCNAFYCLQLLAVYDSASRLLRGHPTVPKAVIDYIVLERNLTLDEASWHIAGKLPPQQPWKRETETQKQDGGAKQLNPATWSYDSWHLIQLTFLVYDFCHKVWLCMYNGVIQFVSSLVMNQNAAIVSAIIIDVWYKNLVFFLQRERRK